MIKGMISQLEKSMTNKMAKKYDKFMGELKKMLAHFEDLREDIALSKHALATTPTSTLVRQMH